MNWYSFAATFVAMFGILLSYKAFKLNRKSSLNLLLSITCFLTAIYTLCTGILYTVTDSQVFIYILRITSTIYILTLISSMLVSFVYAKVGFLFLVIYLVIHIPYDLLVVGAIWNDNWIISGFRESVWGNVLELADDEFWINADRIRSLFDSIVCFILLAYAWITSKSKRRRKILLALFWGTLLVSLLSLFVKVHIWLNLGYPDYSPVLIIIGYLIYFFMIKRYGHLKEDRPLLRSNLLGHIDGLFIFTNKDGIILNISTESSNLLGSNIKIKDNVFNLLTPWSDLNNEWANLAIGLKKVNLGKGIINNVELNLKLIPQIDSYFELEGVLIHLHSSVILDEFSSKFGLSSREKDVLHLIKDGMDNKDISNILFISYATVKNHIHKIFKKTSTGNRAELLSLILTEVEKKVEVNT